MCRNVSVSAFQCHKSKLEKQLRVFCISNLLAGSNTHPASGFCAWQKITEECNNRPKQWKKLVQLSHCSNKLEECSACSRMSTGLCEGLLEPGTFWKQNKKNHQHLLHLCKSLWQQRTCSSAQQAWVPEELFLQNLPQAALAWPPQHLGKISPDSELAGAASQVGQFAVYFQMSVNECWLWGLSQAWVGGNTPFWHLSFVTPS